MVSSFQAQILKDGFNLMSTSSRAFHTYGKQYVREVNNQASSGGASRFYYCPKASKSERNKGCEELPLGEPPASTRSKPAEGRSSPLGQPRHNDHPTVKPLSLMKYLCNLLKTPTGGVLIDPFMGSGSTLLACQELGIKCIGIDIDEHACEIAAKRMSQTVLAL